jgi:NAD(P)H-hydrate epimerase
MARLLGFTSQEVQQDRVEALQNANLRWPYVTVLKGSGTLIGSNNQKMALCRHGHAGMASAGMGDVLAGMIGGYLAQGLSSFQAASSAVLIHALAAEHYATQFDPDGLIASDIIQRIGSVVKNIRLKQSSL